VFHPPSYWNQRQLGQLDPGAGLAESACACSAARAQPHWPASKIGASVGVIVAEVPFRKQKYTEFCDEVFAVVRRTTEFRSFPRDWHDDDDDVASDGSVVVEVKLKRPVDEVVELPNGCDQAATSRCSRCGVMLCDAHRPRRMHRCGRCEQQYFVRIADRHDSAGQNMSGCLVMFGAVVLLVVLFVFGWKVALWSLAAPVLLACAIALLRTLRVVVGRGRFLMEREQRNQRPV
jgi:hypothetical protein